jgi:hypothetical protein
MPAFRLIVKLMIYYAVLAAVLLVVLWYYPSLQDGLPIGRTQALLAQAGDLSAPLDGFPTLPPQSGPLGQIPTFAGSLLWLTAAIVGSLLASLPVSWVYMNIRNPRDYDQSLVGTLLILPIVVTSIVVIVQHSLALAFSLAGIASVARYRNNLKSSGDLLFILHALGIGLAAGIGAVELAILSSAAFNFSFLFLWLSGYGERNKMKRFLAEFDQLNGKRKGPKEVDPPDRAMKAVDWQNL